MDGKFLFSMDRDLLIEELIYENLIQFGVGFKSLRLVMNKNILVDLAVKGEKDAPVVQLAIGAGNDAPPCLWSALDLASAPKRFFEEEKKLEVATEGKSVFEKGSKTLYGSKNGKKNYLRRVRKKITKSKKMAELKALMKVEPEAAEELPIHASSPLLKGSHFHPLAATEGEERVTRIASTPPSPVDYLVKRTPKEKLTLRTRILKNIIHTCDAQTCQTKE
ncbi:hypothetical protein MA16_Dca020029 [Dendrobium catenatum]|uniref:Uncharacterized protein n=1 Tax=Dendrobium catenatum TaxID=906689 RepID=A0A2I0VYL2_9ASPA|nr:hypothetical protein MA16_Dca020029 [Dendrobium catenatum]